MCYLRGYAELNNIYANIFSTEFNITFFTYSISIWYIIIGRLILQCRGFPNAVCHTSKILLQTKCQLLCTRLDTVHRNLRFVGDLRRNSSIFLAV
jgi:hypothetical protein